MGRLNTFALAGLLTAASSAALAADLLPAPVLAPPPVIEEVGSGWYLRGDVGVGSLELRRLDGVNTNTAFPNGGYVVDQKEISDQAFVGAGVGYQFNPWFRADLTGEYRTSASFRALERDNNFVYYNPSTGLVDQYGFNETHGNLRSVVGLANAYVDLGTWGGVTPFIGAGVGFAHHMVSGFGDRGLGAYSGGFGYAKDYDTTGFAWALHAGLGYTVNPNLKLEIAYRYLNLGEAQTGVVGCQNVPDGGCPRAAYHLRDLESHDIKIGMRWMLGGAVAAPVMAEAPIMQAPGPLVRKY